ncbi:MAG: ATP-dependent protease subunit HslV [Candidatus Hydrogenedentes bacterium]|nr:ATP-dependent protease subunit HslV [Candidatus Hydrogenedentota bacterium]
MDKYVEFKGTTIIAVKRNGKIAIAGDGQVTLGDTVIKETASKIRRIYNGNVLVGFAGSVADAFALFERFEGKLEEYKGNLLRAAVELGKLWRTDKYLRQLNAMLVACDKNSLLLISGTGEIIEPDDDLIAIGSGAGYALSAGRALMKHTQLSAEEIARESLVLASQICIYTNNNITIEVL